MLFFSKVFKYENFKFNMETADNKPFAKRFLKFRNLLVVALVLLVLVL